MTVFVAAMASSGDDLLTKAGHVVDLAAGVCALIAIFWTLWRRSVRVSSTWDKLEKLTESIDSTRSVVAHELNHNSGTSVKDKAYAAAETASMALDEARAARADIKELTASVQAVLVNTQHEREAIWAAINGGKSAQSQA